MLHYEQVFGNVFEKEADANQWTTGLLNMKKKGMNICYIMNKCLVMFLKGRKLNVVEY